MTNSALRFILIAETTKGGEHNEKRKGLHPAQLDNADRTMALLATLPENRRSMAITMANAFIAGMEAQARIAAAQAEPNQTAAQS